MKRTWSIVLLMVLCAALCGGCTPKKEQTAPTPTPAPAVTATPTPDLLPEQTPGSTGDPAGTVSDIEGFEEGRLVPENEVPAVTKTVQEKYEGAQIAGITHAMRDGRQTYCVVIRTKEEQTMKVYVAADGTIVAAENSALTEPDGGTGSGTGNGTGGNATQSGGDTGGTDSGANAK